ncbi:Thermostable beta-glucosidase B [Kluyvera cryocrescens]|uniref:Thermostable beta-glucosidase B n=1 Tax=Kluyvera cryocrescens TaxID=580 RepID=A0A485A5E4_KLUCR|nr:Thermostable beta-glucosidase B [Kluyvera cryocrescens]
MAEDADVAVIFVSTAVGEDGENGDRQDLNILPVHERLIREVAAVQPNVVVVLANSDAVVMPWLGECKALLETFFAGQGMGRAVAEILFGHRKPVRQANGDGAEFAGRNSGLVKLSGRKPASLLR